ncbi:MAG: HD domain-containing protein [Chloroflexi bacterium]|nr:HD domain-containing protein [Chloroflexota bacterium]
MSHRLRQGVTGMLAMFQHVDDSPAKAFLDPETYTLYANMSKADRAHSLRVYQRLLAQGHDDTDLLTAALLHDNGKSATHLRVWQRSLKVLLKGLSPQRWQVLSRSAEPGTWRYPFYILQTHPLRGSHFAEQVGCSERTVWLICQHENDPDPACANHALLQALQDADAVS